MRVSLNKPQARPIVEGDIIEYPKSSNGREHGFYMICYIEENKKYFLMSLTGSKGFIRFYNSVRQLIEAQNNTFNIYSKEEYELAVVKIGGEFK